jgi:hypothetical protein
MHWKRFAKINKVGRGHPPQCGWYLVGSAYQSRQPATAIAWWEPERQAFDSITPILSHFITHWTELPNSPEMTEELDRMETNV